jgi:hypothetical protein
LRIISCCAVVVGRKVKIESWINDANRGYRRDRAEFDPIWEELPPPERESMGTTAGLVLIAAAVATLTTFAVTSLMTI